LAVLGAWLLCLPAVAQAAGDAEHEGDASSLTIFDQEWLSAAAMYVGVTVVCVGVFTLIFIKCWLDVGRSGLAFDDPLADAGTESSPGQPADEPSGVAVAAEKA